MTVNKRPLPPTPTSTTSTKYTNVNDAIQSLLQDTHAEHLTEREKRWYTDLTNCHKTIEQKEVYDACASPSHMLDADIVCFSLP